MGNRPHGVSNTNTKQPGHGRMRRLSSRLDVAMSNEAYSRAVRVAAAASDRLSETSCSGRSSISAELTRFPGEPAEQEIVDLAAPDLVACFERAIVLEPKPGAGIICPNAAAKFIDPPHRAASADSIVAPPELKRQKRQWCVVTDSPVLKGLRDSASQVLGTRSGHLTVKRRCGGHAAQTPGDCNAEPGCEGAPLQQGDATPFSL